MGLGGAAGKPKQAIVAATYRTVTTPRTNEGPASVTSSGPRKVNPTANEAWSVRLNTPIAVSSCSRRTTRGIIEPSAGVRKMLVKLIPRMSSSRAATFAPARARPRVMVARARFGPMSARRRSRRSTTTPAKADRKIVGTTNDMTRALTAVLERVDVNTSTVSA